MNIKLIYELLKYFDFFGKSFTFYTEKHMKLYTPTGGILTLLSIIIGILVFIYINFEDLLHNMPNSTTSVSKENYRNVKFEEEKIWIPWRVRDFGGKTVNHFDFLYPIIYYHKGIRNNNEKTLKLTNDFINYKLCNETSMVNNSHLYMIDIDIDQLYCISMEELNIGGSWNSDFLNLITFDLYTCKNGIDYDEKNENCTTYEKIIEFTGENNCLEFEIYYPVVRYQPMNKTTPIFLKYSNYFYHLSRFSNKIDRIYLQKHILKDDKGWIYKEEKSISYWGTETLNGDCYATGDKRDLMNEGSTSRLYSFNIYLSNDVIYYNRSYKKIFLIIADGLPIINIILIFFKSIAKILKISSGNKKLTELLFENLEKKKSIKFDQEGFKIFKVNSKKINMDMNKSKNNNNNNKVKKNKNVI